MGIHVIIQPLAGYGAEIVSPSPGVRQLVAGGEGTTIVVQVPARIGGLSDGTIRAESGGSSERVRRVVRNTEPHLFAFISTD